MAELSGYAIGGRITESVVGDGSVIASDIVVTYKLTQADGSDLAAGTRVEDPVEGSEVLKVGYGNVEGGVTSAEGTQSEDGESTLPAANVWVSDRLIKPNVAAAAVDALVPQNLAWKFDVWANAREAKLGNKKGGTKTPLVTYLVQLDGDADYSSKLLTGVTGPGGVDVLDVLQLVDPTPSAPASDVFAAAMASRPGTINAAVTEATVNGLLDADNENFAAQVRAVPGVGGGDGFATGAGTPVAESIITDGTTTDGWTVPKIANGETLRLDPEAGLVRFGVQTGGTPADRAWFDLPTPEALNGRQSVVVNLWLDRSQSPSYAVADFVAAEDAGLAGERASTLMPLSDGSFQTLVLDVSSLGQIGSVGVAALGTSPVATDHTAYIFGEIKIQAIDAVEAEAEAHAIAATAPAATEVHYGPRSLPDFRPTSALIPNLNGVRHLREWGVPEDGSTDVTALVSAALNDLGDGETLLFPADKAFRLGGSLTIVDRSDVTIDLNGSVLFSGEERTNRDNGSANGWFVFRNCRSVHVRNGSIFGNYRYDGTDYTGADLTGGTLNGTSVELSSLDDETVADHTGEPGSIGNRWAARNWDLELGRAVNWIDLTVSDTNQVTDDVTVEIRDASDNVLWSDTLTATAAPTETRLKAELSDLGKVWKFCIRKATDTANTIAVDAVRIWGRANYTTGNEFTDAFEFDSGAIGCSVSDFWIEGIGGNGVSWVRDCVDCRADNLTIRAVGTQGLAPVWAVRPVATDIHIIGCARSGLDLEPYVDGWHVAGGRFEGIAVTRPGNAGVAIANWSRVTDLRLSAVSATEQGIASIVGARGGTFSQMSFSMRDAAVDSDLRLAGIGCVTSTVTAGVGIDCFDSTVIDGGTPYNCGGNLLADFTIASPHQYGGLKVASGWGTIGMSGPPHPAATLAGNDYTGISKGLTAELALLGLDAGPAAVEYPDTIRGLAVNRLWWPWGLDARGEPAINLAGLSTGATKARNLGGSKLVASGSTFVSVSFLSSAKPSSSLLFDSVIATTRAEATLPAATYHYAIAPIYDWNGRHQAQAHVPRSITIASGESPRLNIKGFFDDLNEAIIRGAAIYRSTVGASGPWSARYVWRPTAPFPSLRESSTLLYDDGSSLYFDISTSDRIYGYPETTAVETGSWSAIEDESGWEDDANYQVLVTPSWRNEGFAVVAKRQDGFDISFDTAAPADAYVDWMLVRGSIDSTTTGSGSDPSPLT